MKYYPRDEKRIHDESFSNWKVLEVGNGTKFLMHTSCRENRFRPTFRVNGTKWWKCTNCNRIAPDEMAFSAELARCAPQWPKQIWEEK